MLCEGEKVYDHFTDCPICGMALMRQESLTANSSEIQIENLEYRNLANKFWISLSFTIPIVLLSMSGMILTETIVHTISIYSIYFQFLFSLPVVFFCGNFIFKRAYSSFLSFHFNMFTLIAIGSGISWLISIIAMLFPFLFPEVFHDMHGNPYVYFESTCVIITLVIMGQLLEARVNQKTKEAIRKLINLTPKQAHLLRNNVETTINIDEISVEDIIKVRPGERITVDGEIIEGTSVVDESMITGESQAVFKTIGSKVIAGTNNGNGSILVRTEKVGTETVLSQIVELVNKASHSKAPIQKTVDKISVYFVPIVVFISIVTFIIWFLVGPEPRLVYGLVNSVAVLIIACPCVLGLATPMAVIAGIGKGSEYGILIKNAEVLENLHKIKVLLLDKTGTITLGTPMIEKVVPYNYDINKLIALAASANFNSEHPLSNAFIVKAKEKKLSFLPSTDFKYIIGMGINCIIEENKLLLGNERFLKTNNIEIPNNFDQIALEAQNEGKIISLAAIDGLFAGLFILEDPLKATSNEAVSKIKNENIEVKILSGDNNNTVKNVALEAGIDQFKGDCLPEDKFNEIIQLQKEGKMVAMAGDGINDSPALSQADIGIAMSNGSDIAIDSSDIVILKGNLNSIYRSIVLSKAVLKNIYQNLAFAFGYNIIGIPIAAGILYPITGILLSPMIAALAMSFSSVSVISNSLRLKKMKL